MTPGTKLGQLRQDVAERTGLPRLDVIAPATHDTGAAVVARADRADWFTELGVSQFGDLVAVGSRSTGSHSLAASVGTERDE